MTTHLDRKELKRPDAFLEKANSVIHFINENSKVFLAGLGLLFLVAVGVAAFNGMRERKAEAAENALFSAKAQLADLAEKNKTIAAGWESTLKPAIERVESVAKEYSGTMAAFEGYSLIADQYYAHGDSGKAAEYYKKAADAAPSRGVKAMANHSLAYAYENSKQYDQAIEALRQVVSSGDKTLKSDALLAMARNYELKGDKPKAIEQYNQVLKDFPNTPAAKSAEAQISHLK